MSLRSFTVVGVFLTAGIFARADIAPTTFAGGTIVPVEISDLRFADARVTITWGSPCSLDASFEIANDRKEPVALEIGFPVGGYDPHYGDDPSANAKSEKMADEPVSPSIIDISINDMGVAAFRRISIPKQCEIRFGHASWYFAKATLVPGVNSIRIKTSLMPSGVYGRPFERRLEYCLWTGGRWNGRIKHERIDIVFPETISKTLIQSVKPTYFQTNANRLVWEFSNIEPKDNFFDIDLVVQIPEVDAIISRMEREYHSKPKDTAAALKFAGHLFQLGNLKGNSGFPPQEFSTVEYHKILARLDGDARETFRRQYATFRADRVIADSSEWTEDRVNLIRILADMNYCENYSGVGHALKAKAILDEVLTRDPRNETAWSLLLDNYWRFSFAAKGHWFGPTVFGAQQIRDIQKAHRLCPRSKPIKRWYDQIGAKDDQDASGSADSSISGIEGSEFRDVLKKYGEHLE